MDSALEELRASYDESPYPLNSYPQSAPGHLAAVAHLFGLDVPPVAQARVLEIGSAVGGNLLPFAAQHPGAQVVGVDLSPVQTAVAQRYVQAAGLDNVTLLVGDIGDIDIEALGPFDYVICHGVYSWVPEKTRESILSVMGRVLASTGIGYLSYNVYPGWKTKEIVREAMLLASADADTPADRVRAARAVAEFLSQAALPDGATARALADHNASASAVADYYLLHEELELFNTPCYFADLVRRAQANGLAYLAEAQPEQMFASNFGADLAEGLVQRFGDDQIQLQQHLDLAINRTFRQSLLVRGERAADISWSLDPRRFADVHFAGWLPPADGETRLDGSTQEFGDPDVLALVTADPIHKVAIDVLNISWPWTVSRDELIDSVRASLPFPRGAAQVESAVDELLTSMITSGQLRYRLEQVRPQQDSVLRLDDSARRLAAGTRDGAEAYSFTAWHETIALSPFDRYLLPLLDGTHNRSELIEVMLGYARRHALGFERAGRRVTDNTELREIIGAQIEQLPYRLIGIELTEAADPSTDESAASA